jgi:hypothetical protein
VVALAGSPAIGATTIADLAGVKFGAQAGTTSLDFIANVIKPTAEPFAYDDNAGAKAALEAKQIDAIVVDLPTAFYIAANSPEHQLLVSSLQAQVRHQTTSAWSLTLTTHLLLVLMQHLHHSRTTAHLLKSKRHGWPTRPTHLSSRRPKQFIPITNGNHYRPSRCV